jgi:hypothetical protein
VVKARDEQQARMLATLQVRAGSVSSTWSNSRTAGTSAMSSCGATNSKYKSGKRPAHRSRPSQLRSITRNEQSHRRDTRFRQRDGQSPPEVRPDLDKMVAAVSPAGRSYQPISSRGERIHLCPGEVP